MLVAKIFSAKIVSERYEPDSLRMLNPDIEAQQPTQVPQVLFGNGWHDIDSLRFRWGGEQMDLVLQPRPSKAVSVELDVEPGPSLPELPLKLEVRDAANRPLGIFTLLGRDRIRVRCDPLSNQCDALRLVPLAKGRGLAADPRHLNIRLFSKNVIPVAEATTQTEFTKLPAQGI